jgi:hypothetical protein
MTNSFNRLSGETSPYLLQHATNPVNWYPWGDEAFAKAKREDKLILVSIGYSSCHWCHVMEKESFSNADVADYMNENYVCIKVDREERPDVDQIYMNAVQIISRSGGWPLNCFALSDGRPVFGGTYFRTQQWMDILQSLHSTWITDKERVLSVAEELTQGLSVTQIIKVKENDHTISPDRLKAYVENWSKYFDIRYGANKGAPKFPMPGSIMFLLDFSWLFNDNSTKQHVKTTLDRMWQGGIYDHLGGGFFRYAVDERWDVPHFEKMLYDNAQLINLYASAYKHFKDEKYRDVVYQSIDFLRREMRSPEGGFYSAIDADSEGEEGKFYTFSKRDIDNLLGNNAEVLSVAYGISASGNHLGKNVLRIAASDNETACLLGLEPDQVSAKLKEAKAKLFNARATRVRPITDDKQLTSWNALTITALVKANIVFGDKRYLTDAINTMQFIEDNLIGDDGSLQRVYCKGKASIPAFLDDYALLIEAYLALYKATFYEKWLFNAQKLTELSIVKFFDADTGMFYYSSSDHDNLIVKKMELTDGVIPSSSAVMAGNLMELAVYFRSQEYTRMADQMLMNICEQLQRGGPYVYRWGYNYLKYLAGPAELFSKGDKAIDSLNSVERKTHHPYLIPCIVNDSSTIPMSKAAIVKGNFRLCQANTCLTAINVIGEVIDRLNGIKI